MTQETASDECMHSALKLIYNSRNWMSTYKNLWSWKPLSLCLGFNENKQINNNMKKTSIIIIKLNTRKFDAQKGTVTIGIEI